MVSKKFMREASKTYYEANKFLVHKNRILKKIETKDGYIPKLSTLLKYKIEIEDICLKAYYIEVMPTIITGHAKGLEKSNAIYPFTRVQMKSFNIASGSRGFHYDNIFNSECATKVICGFVESDSYSGNFKKNPFNFQLFDLNEIELCVDGQSVPSRSLKMSNDKLGRHVIAPYSRLHECTGSNCNLSFGNEITPKQFANGYGLYLFTLYGGGHEGNFMEIKRSANVKIQGNFSTALTKAVTLIIYAEFPAIMELEASRNVIVT